MFAALACPMTAQQDHSFSCLPRPWPPRSPENGITAANYFPPLAKHRASHQQPKHPALVPSPAPKLHISFQLCRMLSTGGVGDTGAMGDVHPVLLHQLGLASPGSGRLSSGHPPTTTSLWAWVKMGREAALNPTLC